MKDERDRMVVSRVLPDGSRYYHRESADGTVRHGYLGGLDQIHSPRAAGMMRFEQGADGELRVAEDIPFTGRAFVGASRAYGAGWDAVFGRSRSSN